MNRNRLHTALVVGLLSICVGCGSGPRLYDIPGSATVDGKAAEGASIIFHPTDKKVTHIPSATVGADGKFTVACDKRNGIPEGSYKVTVIWPDPAIKPTATQKMMGLSPDAPDLLGGAYASKANTPLTVDIKGSMKEIPPFDLKTK